MQVLLRLLALRPANDRLHAAGSHWALSDAAISDNTFVETHDPNPGSPHPVLARTLRNVIPHCLNHDDLARMARNENKPYLVHVQAGKRIYQLLCQSGSKHQPADAPQSLRLQHPGRIKA